MKERTLDSARKFSLQDKLYGAEAVEEKPKKKEIKAKKKK